ncbi:hypothetical protein Dvar_36530 [Desulfosarcina variabilis str. Montpellier]|uniref:hypothetical protein n=1 Tax=Desulfosarcina variabilis TaxID=2300 RepID=UPI003AFA47C0
MNCIEAVEGTAKAVLIKLLDLATEYRMDASEYIRNVKAVMDAIAVFVKNNPEISVKPDTLRDVLYDFAREQWLARYQKSVELGEIQSEKADIEYQTYCYDYIYAHGDYPR